MNLKSKLVTVSAVTVVGVAAAVLPMTVSNAAAACAPAWSASQVYTGGNIASESGHNYRAKWWTQNEQPSTHSQEWAVWADQGSCGGGGEPTNPPTDPPTNPPTDPPTDGTKLAAAPYVYPGWASPPPASTITGKGIRSFTMAFVLASGCNPVWDGEGGLTGGVHEAYINQIRAAGASVVPSFGGWQGNKLGPNCPNPDALAGAYQRVINQFGLRAIDIDIENTDEFENEVVADRIVDALGIIERNNPGIKTIVTFGTSPTGPGYYAKRLVNQAKAKGVPIDVFTQMPFDFGGGDMYQATVGATEGLKEHLKATYGWSDSQAYAHIGISGMNGRSDQGEVTTTRNWQDITNYAKSRGLARLAFWGVNRDRNCSGDLSMCSFTDQYDWQFSEITAGFDR